MNAKTFAKALVLAIVGLAAWTGPAVFAQAGNPQMNRNTAEKSQLAASVEKALESNPMLKNYDFTVSANGRTVTIDGAVFSDREAAEAVKTAKAVPGVERVRQQITFSATGD